MELSNYQVAILDFYQSSQANLQVLARAGSGKTFIIKRVAKLIQPNRRGLFMAFNKHIADTLRAGMPPNVTVGTFNAIGWQICRAQVKGLSYKVDKYKSEGIFKTMFSREDKGYYSQKVAVSRLVSLFKANCLYEVPNQVTIEEYADRYGITLPKRDRPEFFGRLEATYAKCLSYRTIMDFDDQVFMPLYLGLDLPKFDDVIIDEAQDLNPLRQEFAVRLGGRIITVGDDRQAIYGFTGADPKSMETMREKTNAEILPLSICYRCPRKVVELAQRIVPSIEAAPTAADGVVEEADAAFFEREARDGDYVLCRTTAPLVSTCLEFIRKGIKASVRGRDIGQQLLQVIDAISGGDFEAIELFNGKLTEYKLEQIARLEKAGRDDQIIDLNDRVDTINALAESCEAVGDIKKRVNEIFADEKILQDGTILKIPGIVFCTVHRSKGLEAKRVWILKRELMPHPSAKTPDQMEQEANLEYVAYTRALEELRFVVDKVTVKDEPSQVCNCGGELDGSHDHVTCGPPVHVENDMTFSEDVQVQIVRAAENFGPVLNPDGTPTEFTKQMLAGTGRLEEVVNESLMGSRVSAFNPQAQTGKLGEITGLSSDERGRQLVTITFDDGYVGEGYLLSAITIL